MPSVIDICNKGLDKLGQSPITSLSDNTKASNLCSRNWPLVRDQVLRDHPWNFAVKRAILAPSTDVPEWGFSYKFPLPGDFIRLLEVRDLSTGEYQVEDGHIMADSTVLYIRYIYRVEDVNKYDVLFSDTAAARLAFELAEPLTQSTSKKETAFSEYEDSLTRARRVDGQENPPVPFEEDEWISVRY